MPRLTVVIPVFNEPDWIAHCYQSLVIALGNAEDVEADIIIVDDGSDIPTQLALESCTSEVPTTLLRQENRGRLLARRAGIEAAQGDWLLFLDSRTIIDPTSIKFVFDKISDEPSRRIWNAHTEMNVVGDPYNRFWRVITAIAWKAYLSNPRDISFGIAEFDKYPKGTTCLLAPRNVIQDALLGDLFLLRDLSMSNDDTTVLRQISLNEAISMNPGFSCTYFGRGNSFRKFLSHSVHRGTVFLDGHLIAANRYRYILWMYFVCTVLVVLLIVKQPLWALATLVAGYCTIALIIFRLHRNFRDNFYFLGLGLPFLFAYGFGLWKGLFLYLRQRLRRF